VVLTLGAANFLMLGAFYAFAFSAPMLLGAASGLDATHVGYVISAGGLVGAATMLANTWHSDRTGERYLHSALPLFAGGAAFAVLANATTPAVVLIAYVCTLGATFAFSPTLWTVSHALLPQRSAAVSIAAINTIGQTGSFLAPFAWGLAKDATGSFHAGETVLPFAYALSGALILALGWRARAGRAARLQPSSSA
jgi:ACS family tartrate transporter-like MFS transporter